MERLDARSLEVLAAQRRPFSRLGLGATGAGGLLIGIVGGAHLVLAAQNAKRGVESI